MKRFWTAFFALVIAATSASAQTSPYVWAPGGRTGLTPLTDTGIIALWASGGCTGVLNSDGTCIPFTRAQIVSLWSACAGYLFYDGTCSAGTNVPTLPITAAAFYLHTVSAGPMYSFFDDVAGLQNLICANIGSPSGGNGVALSVTYQDQNHPGNGLISSGTAGTGTGESCMYAQSSNQEITTPNSSLGWNWESAVYVPVLPGSTVGAYQAGIGNGNVNPWTVGIGFYLSSDNGVANDWYCRYGTTSTDSTVAATVAWVRLSVTNDGIKAHWYVNGTEVCGTGVAIASLPSSNLHASSFTVTAKSASSVQMAVDYFTFNRSVIR